MKWHPQEMKIININIHIVDTVYANVTYVASVATPQLLSFIDMRM